MLQKEYGGAKHKGKKFEKSQTGRVQYFLNVFVSKGADMMKFSKFRNFEQILPKFTKKIIKNQKNWPIFFLGFWGGGGGGEGSEILVQNFEPYKQAQGKQLIARYVWKAISKQTEMNYFIVL